MSEVEERIDRLEEAQHEFVLSVGIEFNKLYNSQMRTEAELRAFKDEMKDFKDEMKDFKDEMKDFKDEMKDFKDEMKDFKDEMKDFKDEMKDFKDEMKDEMKDFKGEMKSFKEESRQANREMNRRWGELANKMGTLVEESCGSELATDRAGVAGAGSDGFISAAQAAVGGRADLGIRCDCGDSGGTGGPEQHQEHPAKRGRRPFRTRSDGVSGVFPGIRGLAGGGDSGQPVGGGERVELCRAAGTGGTGSGGADYGNQEPAGLQAQALVNRGQG